MVVPFQHFSFPHYFLFEFQQKKTCRIYKNMQIKENILFGNLLQVQECYHYVNEEQFLIFFTIQFGI